MKKTTLGELTAAIYIQLEHRINAVMNRNVRLAHTLPVTIYEANEKGQVKYEIHYFDHFSFCILLPHVIYKKEEEK